MVRKVTSITFPGQSRQHSVLTAGGGSYENRMRLPVEDRAPRAAKAVGPANFNHQSTGCPMLDLKSKAGSLG